MNDHRETHWKGKNEYVSQQEIIIAWIIFTKKLPSEERKKSSSTILSAVAYRKCCA